MRGTLATASRFRPFIIYGLMLVGMVLIYGAIRSYGEGLTATAPIAAPLLAGKAAGSHAGDLLHILAALAVVIATARVLGTLFKVAHQPAVIGEIIAGILLGPSLLGRIAPLAYASLFPPRVAPFLNVIAQVGVILYMFLVGLELDPTLMRKRGHATVAISHTSIIAPFLLGAALALLLYPKLSSSAVSFTNFSLFLGVSMSVTAFPVLARILTDRRIHKTRMGALALTCAAVDDITAWCMLAFVVGVARAEGGGAARTIALALGFVALMIFVVRPAMVRLSLMYGNRGRMTQGVMTLIFVALLLSSLATEVIGIHAIFGAFALGAVIPHDSEMAREMTDRLEDLVVVLLLPAFFAYTGLRTQIGLVSGVEEWLLCGLIIVVASAGKFGGSALAARLSGLSWRDASALGVLMNTRGLMELIVLNIGFEMGIISPTLFAMLVLMALVTTFATTPVLHLITRDEPIDAPVEPATQPARAMEGERSAILVPIANPDGVAALVGLALAATPADAPPPRVLALVRRPIGGVRSGLREVEQRVPPRSPALSAALDLAWAYDAVITPQAVWTDDPAADILRTAHDPQIGWLLLGSHRSVFGRDFRGGVVREILRAAQTLPIDVGIVNYREQRPFERVFAVIDRSSDGRAALDLAGRIARQKECNLHAVMVPRAAGEPDAELLRMLSEAAGKVGRRLHTDVLVSHDAAQLARQTPGGLVVVGARFADRLGLSPNGFTDGRAVVLVQGSTVAPARGSGVGMQRHA